MYLTTTQLVYVRRGNLEGLESRIEKGRLAALKGKYIRNDGKCMTATADDCTRHSLSSSDIRLCYRQDGRRIAHRQEGKPAGTNKATETSISELTVLRRL